MNEEKLNAVQSLIGELNSPIAQRQGYSISAEDCKIWVEELTKFLEQFGWHPASETPVIPNGKDRVKLVAIVECSDGNVYPIPLILDKGDKWDVDDCGIRLWCYQPQND